MDAGSTYRTPDGPPRLTTIAAMVSSSNERSMLPLFLSPLPPPPPPLRLRDLRRPLSLPLDLGEKDRLRVASGEADRSSSADDDPRSDDGSAPRRPDAGGDGEGAGAADEDEDERSSTSSLFSSSPDTTRGEELLRSELRGLRAPGVYTRQTLRIFFFFFFF